MEFPELFLVTLRFNLCSARQECLDSIGVSVARRGVKRCPFTLILGLAFCSAHQECLDSLGVSARCREVQCGILVCGDDELKSAPSSSSILTESKSPLSAA